MKFFIIYTGFFLLFIAGQACKQKAVESEEPVKINKEDVVALFYSNPFRVVGVYSFEGKDSTDMSTDPAYGPLLKAVFNTVFVTFRQNGGENSGFMIYNTGSAISNKEFPISAETFRIDRKIDRPVNLSYEWDDQQATFKIKVRGQSDLFRMFKDGQEGYLDPKTLTLYKTITEAQNAKKTENLTFIYYETTPSARVITHKIFMKPLWYYYSIPQSMFYDYVMF